MLPDFAMVGPGALVAAAVAAAVAGCGASLPGPPLTRHPTSALVPVPYPPPPARVEQVPPRPRDDAVWIDGEWTWRGGYWAWKYGRWVVPPEGAAYAPWTTTRGEDGTLFFAAGAFRDATGALVPAPRPLARGRASEDDVPDPEGDVTETGPNVNGAALGR